MIRALFSFGGAAWARRHYQSHTYVDIASGDSIIELPAKEDAAQGWKYGIGGRSGLRRWLPLGWAYGLKHPKYREWKANRDRDATRRLFAANDFVDLATVRALELQYVSQNGAE